MAIQAAKLVVEIGADIHNLQKGLRESDSALSDFSARMLKGGAIMSAAVTTPAIFAAKEVFKVGAAFEQNKIAFETMLGSPQKAEAFLKELREFAKPTQFTFTQLQDAARRMMAFGFAAEQVVPMLTDIGDAAAGLGIGAEGVDRITLALGQMQAKTKVSAQEMMQLTEAGVPAWRYLASAMGMSTAEVMKLSEQGLIPADQAIQAILAGMRQDFGGMMAKQAGTAASALSGLKDDLDELATGLSTTLLPVAKELINNAREAVQWFGALPDGVKQSIVQFVGLAAAIGPVMIGMSTLASGMNTLIGTGRMAITVVQGLSATFSAYRAGLTLTTALGAAGLSSMTIALGSVALAAGAVVAVWAQWNKQITETNRRGQEAVSSAWKKFFEEQAASGKSARQVLEEYRAAQARVNAELEKAGALKILISDQEKLKGDLEGLNQALARTAASYQEYLSVVRQSGEPIEALSYVQWQAAKGLQELNQTALESGGLAGIGGTAAEGSAGFELLTQAAQNTKLELDELIAKQEELKNKMDAWLSQTAGQVATALGQYLWEGSQRYRDALAEVDAVMGTNYLMQLETKEAINALVNEYARTGDLDAFREGLIKIRDEGLAGVQQELEKTTQKAQELYNVLQALPRNIKIKIDFEVGAGPKLGTDYAEMTKKFREAESAAGKQLGGPVYSGRAYLVGERGPELFVPGVSGRVLSNPGLVGGNTYQITVNGGGDGEEIASQVITALRRMELLYA